MNPASKGNRAVVTLLVGLFAFGYALPSNAACTDGKYALSVTPSKKVFSQGEEIRLLITFSNLTNADVAIDMDGLAYGVVGISGRAKNNPNSRLVGELANPQGANSKTAPFIVSQLVKQVKARSSYSAEVTLHHRSFLPRTGRYHALAYYRPPDTEGLPVEMVPCALEANKTMFEVK